LRLVENITYLNCFSLSWIYFKYYILKYSLTWRRR